ncbi:sideroflexin-1 [Platysternon megacephalum]|uniref:Sideroflexin-1 n=1 Tax=Platysternon megacephalum TaxID=55544 RepID=A0A4D9EWQ9_9SAUR|nr:sideroflexin-1 [Platysternon megacephalum]
MCTYAVLIEFMGNVMLQITVKAPTYLAFIQHTAALNQQRYACPDVEEVVFLFDRIIVCIWGLKRRFNLSYSLPQLWPLLCVLKVYYCINNTVTSCFLVKTNKKNQLTVV